MACSAWAAGIYCAAGCLIGVPCGQPPELLRRRGTVCLGMALAAVACRAGHALPQCVSYTMLAETVLTLHKRIMRHRAAVTLYQV